MRFLCANWRFTWFRCPKKGIEINQNKTKPIMETRPPSTKKELQSLLGKFNFLRRFISNLSGKTRAFTLLLRLKKEEFKWQQEHQKIFDEIKEYTMHLPILSPPVKNKCMRLYIFASYSTIKSMLAQKDDNGVERVTYYLSRVLNDAETRYSLIERCVFVCISHV